MSLRSMTKEEKLALLQGLGTADLVKKLNETTTILQGILTEKAEFESKNSDYLGGRSDDCRAIKAILSSLIPPEKEGGKKMAVAEAASWTLAQRTANPALAEAVQKQKMAEFSLDEIKAREIMADRNIANLRLIINLKIAQIQFFAGDIQIQIKDTTQEVTNQS